MGSRLATNTDIDYFSDLDELIVCIIAIEAKAGLVMTMLSRRFRNCMAKLPDYERERTMIEFCYNCADYGVSETYLDFAAAVFVGMVFIQNPLSAAISRRNLPAAKYLAGKITLHPDYNPFLHVLRHQMADIGYDREITNDQDHTDIDHVVCCYYRILESQFGFKLDERAAKGPPRLLDRIAQTGYKKTFNWVTTHGIKREPSQTLIAIRFGRNSLAKMLLKSCIGDMHFPLCQAAKYNNSTVIIYIMTGEDRDIIIQSRAVIIAAIWGSTEVLGFLKELSRIHGNVIWPTLQGFINEHTSGYEKYTELCGESHVPAGSVWELIMETSGNLSVLTYLYNHMEGRSTGPLIIPKWDTRAIFAALAKLPGDATEVIQWMVELGCPIAIELTQEYRTSPDMRTVFDLAGRKRALDGSLEWLVRYFRNLGEKNLDPIIAAIGIDMNNTESMELVGRAYVRQNIEALRALARAKDVQDIVHWLDMQI